MTKALLLVTMEPPAGMEVEFNDWYDTEHLPQRRALPGFLNGSRWVCLEGWPRWLAIYDMESVAALHTPQYEAVSGPRSTPWSRRILPATLGRRRIVATQVYPGDALAPPPEEVARLALAYFPRPQPAGVAALVDAAAGVGASLRLFADEAGGIWSLATFSHVVTLEQALPGLGVERNGGARLANLYAPYTRVS